MPLQPRGRRSTEEHTAATKVQALARGRSGRLDAVSARTGKLNANWNWRSDEGAHELISEVGADAARFAEHDRDGDAELDFDEFLAVQTESVRRKHSTEEIRQWFDLARGERETISVDAFFTFSLSKASLRAGASSLRESFKRWDKNGGGYLDALDLASGLAEMGFGGVTHTLFTAMDTDNSGGITLDELEAALLHSASKQSPLPGAKELITSLVWSSSPEAEGDDEGRCAKATMDTSKWALTAKDAPSLRAELQQRLRESGAYVADVLRLFDKVPDDAHMHAYACMRMRVIRRIYACV